MDSSNTHLTHPFSFPSLSFHPVLLIIFSFSSPLSSFLLLFIPQSWQKPAGTLVSFTFGIMKHKSLKVQIRKKIPLHSKTKVNSCFIKHHSTSIDGRNEEFLKFSHDACECNKIYRTYLHALDILLCGNTQLITELLITDSYKKIYLWLIP